MYHRCFLHPDDLWTHSTSHHCMSILLVTANIETPFLCRRVEMNWKRNQQYLERNVCTPIPTLLEHWSSPNHILLLQCCFINSFSFLSPFPSMSLSFSLSLSLWLTSYSYHYSRIHFSSKLLFQCCYFPMKPTAIIVNLSLIHVDILTSRRTFPINALCIPNGRLEEHITSYLRSLIYWFFLSLLCSKLILTVCLKGIDLILDRFHLLHLFMNTNITEKM